MAPLEQIAIELTGIERAGPRAYIRQIFPLRLDENYDIEEVTRVLLKAYKAACNRVAVLSCEAVPDPDGKQSGLLKMQKLPEHKIGRATIKNLRTPYAFPFSYNELRERNFSLYCFDDAVLLDKTVWPSLEKGMPATSLQINFIRGGVILGWSVLHMIGDARTYFVWSKIFAEECRRIQGLEITDPFVLDEAMVTDRQRVMKSSGRNNGEIEPYLGVSVLPFVPTSVPPGMLSPTHRAQIFYFSPESLAALKADADPANAIHIKKHHWISTNDAFAALVWKATMSVQAPLESLKDGGKDESIYALALSCRSRINPPAHPYALGCWLGFLPIRAPIGKVLTTYNLADLAGLVRNGMQYLDKDYTDKILTIIDKLDDVNKFVPTVFFKMMSTSILATSWADIDLYNVEWGPMFGNRMEAVRVSNCGISPGCSLVLPRLPNGGLELVVGTEAVLLPKLCADPLFMKYAQAK